MELHCINRVELRGFVGTSKVTSIGDKKAVRFSLATNYAYRDKEGCPVIETTGIIASRGQITTRMSLCTAKERPFA